MDTEKKSKNRIWQFDLLRIAACLLVLLVHVSAQWLNGAVPGSRAVLFAQACNILAFSGVSLFAMLSGALALRREMTVKEAVVKKFLHFVLLYEIWREFYFVFHVVSTGQAKDPAAWKTYVLDGFFKIQGHYHLWFLPMIAVLFLLVPLIREGAEKLPVCLMYLTAAVILGFAVPTFTELHLPGSEQIGSLAEPFPAAYFSGYLGYFLLGHVMYRWRERLKGIPMALLHTGGLVAFLLACMIATQRGTAAGEVYYGLDSPLNLFNLVTSAAIFSAIVGIGDASPVGTQRRRLRLLAALADASFGVYLLHPAVLYLLTDKHPAASVTGPGLGIPCLLFILYGISLLVSSILLKVPLLRRLVS